MKIFLIFLLLFNSNIDKSRAYFNSPDDQSDLNTKQCFCEVSFIHSATGFPVKNFLFINEHVNFINNNNKTRFLRAIA